MTKITSHSVCWILLCCFITLTSNKVLGQQKNNVYVDAKGVLRWQKSNKEAAFFGVNYTVPFAYGYRSHKALNVDLEKAIDQDVYHFARLGIDAFRVHLWDTEITDSVGNLLENDHLKLFDYLVFKLKQRQIKVMLTPIAFWGNGYPEKDEKTLGFSSNYPKQRALVHENAIRAQERYLEQFFKHVNPYTKTTYQNDPDVIAAEINNEPHHSGPKAKVTEYVNRMVKVVRGTGWTKPIFYNISESPKYADAVAKANVDGFSFQWYPTGLVANRTLPGNYLPHVDLYHIPFDTISAFAGKARMVYEFDAGDILQATMYPAMARSFRAAGFQWATQFAYDPMATAYGNTEYQTHYLNLAYTPAKAISLMIASKAFHLLPRLKNYGTYPADSVFSVFRVSYKESLSEMNTVQEFYYSNTTRTKPKNLTKLQHIAGVGSSPVVNYQGYGAYFIDKLENGVWRLEVMPDAIHIRDPFAKASPQKEVTRIQWQTQPIQLNLPDLGSDFRIKGINDGNNYTTTAQAGNFQIQPGTYLLTKENKKNWSGKNSLAVINLNEFVAPQPFSTTPYVVHEPASEITANKPFSIKTKVVGVEASDKVTLQINNLSGVFKTIPLNRLTAYDYSAEVPADVVTPGLLNYLIIIQKANNQFYTFPGNHRGNPYAWDYANPEVYQTFVASEQGKLLIFDAGSDRNLYVYPNLWRSDEKQLITAEEPKKLILRLSAKELSGEKVMGWQHYFADKLEARQSEISSFTKLVIKARTNQPVPVKVKVNLITRNAAAFAANVSLNNTFQTIEIPFSNLKPDAFILLPRPYPGFQPFWFKLSNSNKFQLDQAEKLEITLQQGSSTAEAKKNQSFEVESVWLGK